MIVAIECVPIRVSALESFAIKAFPFVRSVDGLFVYATPINDAFWQKGTENHLVRYENCVG